MGFGIRIAPGVRISASSRGVSAGVGPRIARAHVGTRGVGVSSGVGPFSTYSGLRGSARRRSSYSGGRQPSLASLQRRAEQQERKAERERQQVERLREIANLEELERQLVSVHLVEFPDATRPQAGAPEPVNIEALRGRLEAEAGVTDLRGQLEPFGMPPTAPTPAEIDRRAVIAEQRKDSLHGVPLLRLGQRRQAKQDALAAAEAAIAAEEARRQQDAAVEQERLDRLWQELQGKQSSVQRQVEQEAKAEAPRRADAQRAEQERLDQQWDLLQTNDQQTVIAALEEAFADNEAPAAPIDCQEWAVTIAIKFGHPDAIPERRPSLTPAGRPTIKKRTKTERNELYFEALASSVLATVKEAFAVAPKIERASVLVMRQETSTRDACKLAAVYGDALIEPRERTRSPRATRRLRSSTPTMP